MRINVSSLKTSISNCSHDVLSKKLYHLPSRQESNETYTNVTGLNGKELRHDGLGRLHLTTPYTGNAYLKIRSHKYNSTTAATHVTDLYSILSPLKSDKSVYFFLADGGPDFNPSHIANDLYYYRLFKKLDADILGVMTYAARYSAFNPIEHCWSPLSNKLSGVTFSPLENEDDASAPGFSKEELKEKEKVVFDRAMKSLAEYHWNNFKFNEFPVDVEPVLVGEDELLFDDYDRVKSFLKTPIRDLHKYLDLLKEFKEMFAHIDRHLNEVTFIKCEKSSCCGNFKSKITKELLGEKKRFPSPSLSL